MRAAHWLILLAGCDSPLIYDRLDASTDTTVDRVLVDVPQPIDSGRDVAVDAPSSSAAQSVTFRQTDIEIGTNVDIAIPIDVFDQNNVLTSAPIVLTSSNTQVLVVDSSARTMRGISIGTATIGVTSPTSAMILSVTVHLGMRTVRTGFLHGCGLDGLGQAWCWGCNQNGQSGGNPPWNGGRQVFAHPSRVQNVPPAREGGLALGWHHSCALDVQGHVTCWGYNDQGQLGSPEPGQYQPYAAHPNLSFVSIAAGQFFTCGLTSEGALYCWGDGRMGQLGDGGMVSHGAASRVGNLSFASVSLGDNHACALTTAGALYCWGSNDSGQLGLGTSGGTFSSPQLVAAGPYASVELGENFSCVLDASGVASCFGRDEQDKGALGIGRSGNANVPTLLATETRFSQLAAGFRSNCGLDLEGRLYCWGSNDFGLLADGDLPREWRELAPLPAFDIGVRFSSIALTRKQNCVISSTHVAYCWGENPNDTLGVELPGNPPTISVNRPTRLRDSDGVSQPRPDWSSCF